MVHTTVTRRIDRGVPNPLGWRSLISAAGEAHPDDLPDGEVLACLWHLSDLHLCDAESPVRVAYLDRFADPDSSLREEIGEVGTYRPQEILTVQVAAAMVETVNAITTGPVTGAPIDAVLITGDVTDNAQANELDWYTTLVNGGTVTPGSGASTSTWSGVSDPDSWDEHYWHPDGPPPGLQPDRAMRLFGYPRVPGLIEAARRPVHSPGLNFEVLSVHGNHDALLQGTVASDDNLRAFAVGDQEITGLSPDFDPREITAAVAPNGPAAYLVDPNGPRRSIPADPRRAIVAPGDFAHAAGRETNYWSQDVSRLRVISLDTVNPFGGWQGSLDEVQFAWLRAQLATDSYIVIASHHPSPTMTNDYAPHGQRRVLGPEVVAELLHNPRVLIWIAGHVHFNAAIRHGDEQNWFWEVTTASLIDWPQQGRIFEFVETTKGVAIISTVVDHDSPLAWEENSSLTTSTMAGISRLLAANDYQRRDPTPLNELREGAPEVRNVVWRVNTS